MELPSGAVSFNESKPPKYLIAVSNETGMGDFMGKFVSQTEDAVTFNPWNFLVGGIHLDRTKELKKQHFTFLGFATEEEMDFFCSQHYWDKDDEERKQAS